MTDFQALFSNNGESLPPGLCQKFFFAYMFAIFIGLFFKFQRVIKERIGKIGILLLDTLLIRFYFEMKWSVLKADCNFYHGAEENPTRRVSIRDNQNPIEQEFLPTYQ